MAISSFKSGVASTPAVSAASAPTEPIPIAVAAANTYYSLSKSLPSGTYTMEKPTTAEDLLFIFFDADGVIIYENTLDAGVESSIQFVMPAQSEKILIKSSAAINLTLTYIGDALLPEASTSIVTVSSSQQVTLTKETIVVALGGGGNGRSTNAGNSVYPGAGSGYMTIGRLAPGTYSAVVGAATSATSIGSISAAGNQGESSGGSGGGSWGIWSNSGNQRTGSGGYKGNAGGGTDGDPGNGTGVVPENYLISASFINSAELGLANSGGVGSNGNAGTGGGGVYAGGGGGWRPGYPANKGYNGGNANGWGGGGGAAVGYGNAAYTGGSGYQGVIWYREID